MRSPIEGLLRNAIRDAKPSRCLLDDYTNNTQHHKLHTVDGRLHIDDQEDSEVPVSFGPAESGDWVALYANVRVLTYRIDLLLVADANGGEGFVAVECDGHDYHDRTKQQAASDRARDRELIRIGIPTLRFTGSEIYHDAFRCAQECWAMVPIVNRQQQLQQAAFSSGWRCAVEAARELKAPNTVGLLSGVI